MNGEDTLDSELSTGGGNEACHPIVTMDDVRLHEGDNVVDHLSLKGQGRGMKIAVVGTWTAIECAVFGQMNAGTSAEAGMERCPGEEVAIVWNGKMNIGTGEAKLFNNSGGDLGHTAGLGPDVLGSFAHSR